MSDATLARMEHGKYVGVREESRHDGVCTLRKQTLYVYRLPGDDVNPLSRLGIAAERLRSPSVSAPHRESLARPTGPGLLTYLIVYPKYPKQGTVSSFAARRGLPRWAENLLTYVT